MKKRMRTPRSRFVCEHCRDTHAMLIGPEDSRREVPCTRCPVPCQACRQGGYGAFCEHTPCGCACHVRGPAAAASSRSRHATEAAQTTLQRIANALELVALCEWSKRLTEGSAAQRDVMSRAIVIAHAVMRDGATSPIPCLSTAELKAVLMELRQC